MDDRELLELAAKVAGPKIQKRGESWIRVLKSNIEAFIFTLWDPLVDDGDAFRLAVDLGMVVHIDLTHCNCVEVEASGGVLVIISFEPQCDHYAVVRKAIVQAASEIGKEMS